MFHLVCMPLFADMRSQIILIVMGLPVGIAAYVIMGYRFSVRWRRLAEAYEMATRPSDAIAIKRNDYICLFDGLPQRYLGAVDISITTEGVDLRINPVFRIFYPFHRPILIPFDEISITPTSFG